MATTSFSLGEHWENFIKAQVETGRYATASEVLRTSLRILEQREARLEALRAAIKEGLDSPLDGDLDFDEIKRMGREAVARRPQSVS